MSIFDSIGRWLTGKDTAPKYLSGKGKNHDDWPERVEPTPQSVEKDKE